MFYAIAKVLVRFAFLFVYRVKFIGRENVPKTGGMIFAANHGSNWDPPLLAIASPRRLSFMAKSELFKNKLFGALIKALGAFPVHRGKGDIGAIKTSLSILKAEQAMIMFPEGGRVKKGTRPVPKPGVAMIASRAKVPVIPVTIEGSYRWLSKMTVTFGEPIYFDEYYDEKLSVEKLQELSGFIMDRIYEKKA